MANSDKNIKITPNISQTAQPNVVFTGQGNVPITLKVLDDSYGTLSFEGSAGQLFSINNNLSTGVIFSVNDISGIPQIDVNADGTIRIAPFGSSLQIAGLTLGRGSGGIVSNTVLGSQSFASCTTGVNNTAIGQISLANLTTGNNNTGIGSWALGYVSTTSQNTALGAEAGRLNTSGTSLTGVINCIYIGYQSIGTNSASNEIVIGAAGAGKGSNTTVIGNTSTVSTDVFGTLTTTLTAAAQKGLIVKGFTSQSANLTEWQNSAGTLLAAVNSSGEFGIGTSPVAGRKINTNGSIVTSGSVIASFGSYDMTISGTSIGRGSGAGNVSFGDPGASQAGTTIAYNTAGTTVSAGIASVVCNNAASRGLIVTAAASQTANLQEWRNSGGTALAYVNSAGNIVGAAISGSLLYAPSAYTDYWRIRSFYRAAPTTVGNYIEICSIQEGTGIYEIYATSEYGASIGTTSKKYTISTAFGSWTGNTLTPRDMMRQSGYTTSFDFELELHRVGAYDVRLRLRRTAGTSARYVTITVQQQFLNAADITALSGTGTSPYGSLSQGFYIAPSNYALPVPGGSGAGNGIAFYAGAGETTGAGGGITLQAGSAAGTGAGGSIILQPGAQATSGGNGVVIVRQPGGTAGTDEGQISHSGTHLTIQNKDDGTASGILITQTAGYGIYVYRDTGLSIINAAAGTLTLAYQSSVNLSFWSVSGSTGAFYTFNDSYRIYWPGSGLLSNAGAILSITGGSTSGTSNGGSLAFKSSSPSGYTANQNDLVLTGSAFQRLSGTAARDITGVAPPSGGSHVDGRMMRIYNVGSFNLTLKHNSTSSTAANRFFCIQSVDIIVSSNDFAELIYDSTNNGSGAAGWRVA